MPDYTSARRLTPEEASSLKPGDTIQWGGSPNYRKGYGYARVRTGVVVRRHENGRYSGVIVRRVFSNRVATAETWVDDSSIWHSDPSVL